MGEQDPGIGLRVRTARARLGWSREALAFHSGVSWAGIGQVESGRRRDIRAGTLTALATALGVTTDYLLLGRPGARMFDHRLLVYSSEEELLAAAAPFLAAAAEPSEAALAIVSKRNISLLRRGVGRAGAGVRFAESSGWYSSPLAALNAYEEFCATSLEQGAAWVRIVAELGWAHRSPSATRPWIRFESLLDLVFANLPVSILCVCDAASLRPTVGRQLSVMHADESPSASPGRVSSDTDPVAFLL
jgi:transcriptional regulator with XRE-family HTH domain